jgi:hypothetical protein
VCKIPILINVPGKIIGMERCEVIGGQMFLKGKPISRDHLHHKNAISEWVTNNPVLSMIISG